MAKYREYKVEVVCDAGLSTLLFGSANINTTKLQQKLNDWALQGWVLNFMVTEHRRFLLFWKREAVIITLTRNVER